MPRNIFGGNKHKRGKNKRATDDQETTHVTLSEEGQVYAIVKKKLGGTRVQGLCSDGIERQIILRGKMLKKVWVNSNDILLCDLNTTGKASECSAVIKYKPHEIRMLKDKCEINFEVDTSDIKFDTDTVDPNLNIPKSNRDSLPDSSDSEEDSDDDNTFATKKKVTFDDNITLDDI